MSPSPASRPSPSFTIQFANRGAAWLLSPGGGSAPPPPTIQPGRRFNRGEHQRIDLAMDDVRHDERGGQKRTRRRGPGRRGLGRPPAPEARERDPKTAVVKEPQASRTACSGSADAKECGPARREKNGGQVFLGALL